MYSANIRIPLHGKPTEAVVDATTWLLAVWFKNGQILGSNWPLVNERGVLQTFVSLPARDALSSRHSNSYVRRALANLASVGLGKPRTRVVGRDPASEPECTCTARRHYILFTHYLTIESPLRCGECFGPVPLYRIPHLDDDEYLDVLQWVADYQACDTLQMHTTVGERFAERQLADVRSALSNSGRAICRDISQKTGVPTYYFLMKARARSLSDERGRMCPSCGRRWRLKEPAHSMFDFQCKSCLLLSNLAYSLSRSARTDRAE